ncbi:ATP synthase subunit I [Desulfonema ishimotonii]|uniref:ATP synthase subunit I n=2 Tax=Desulfonema ishimotonii TaxID=45657 RepID=A0A401G1T3_9BACT|nr:ATP synthase subunit I [Desulfonema ishimotonii]
MKTIRDTEKKYCSRALVTAIIIGFVLIVAGYKPIARGLILGTLFSIFNFILMGETLPKRVNQSAKKSFALALGSVFFRYAVLAIPLIAAFRSEKISVIAAACGIFAVQLMILADYVRGFVASARVKGKAL